MFDNYYQLRRDSHPYEPKYISLCFVLQGSGADKAEIKELFDFYMVEEEDYDKPERKEMIDYLVKVSNEP